MTTASEVLGVIPGQHSQHTGTATPNGVYGPPTATPTPLRQPHLGSGSGIQKELAAEFSELADRWHRETGMYSLEIQKTSHPAYLRIIGMGSKAIPFILRDLEQNGGHWYQALESIVGYSPVQISKPGNIRQSKAQWLAWGHRLQYM